MRRLKKLLKKGLNALVVFVRNYLIKLMQHFKQSECARIYRATLYSLGGLKAAWKEAAFRTECILGLILFPLAIFMPLPALNKGFIIESMVLVLIIELLNIGLEETVNYISKDIHPLAKKIKDVGSAAVFLALLNVLFMWIWGLLVFTKIL